MKTLFFLFISILAVRAAEYKSNIALKYINYDSYTNEALLEGDTKLKFENEYFTTNVEAEYLYSSEYKQRRYLLLNELYISKDFEDYNFILGKMIKFSGELEGFNVVDVLNQRNYLLDPFKKSAKLGSYILSVTRYFDESSLEFGVKFYEEGQKYPTKTTPYTLFPLAYDDTLRCNNQAFTPTVYSTYMYESMKFTALHGYDNKRYFIALNQNKLAQYAYRVNKFLLSSNYLYGDTIFKFEGSYTNVIDDKNMGDYSQLAFGMENNIYGVYGADIGIYSEYYRYIYLQEGLKNVDISELYNHDLFLAIKLNFNDVGASEIKGGVLHDIQNSEEVVKVEAKTRVIDMFVLKAEFLQTLPKQNTILSNIGESTRLNFSASYTF